MGKFANKPTHKQSKRKKLKIKYNIDKKVKQHNKKLRKEAKKMKALGIIKKKSKENIELPNLYPLKLQVIEGLERKKQQLQRMKQIEQLKNQDQFDLNLEKIEAQNQQYEEKQVEESKLEDTDYSGDIMVRGGKKYFRELKKVLEASDIILEILDARDPESCRCKKLEADILSMKGDKKIILVINKIDLIPHGNAEAWLTYMRREYATVLFKANTQQQSGHLSQNTLFKKSLKQREQIAEDMLSSNKAVGAENLLQLIKNYSKQDGVKQSVTVGVIGYPNVGKSSVINSLKRSKACGVSSQPGFTKHLQEIQIDNQVKVLDCPGVIFDDDNKKDTTVLRNIIKIDEVDDYIKPIELIISKIAKNNLLLAYKIPDFKNVNEFLINVAETRKKYIKGGTLDLKSAAGIILQDWNAGKIKYFTIPPKVDENQIEQETVVQ